eukprot:scaffold3210_cov4495-Pavlova_lutheri.AAC.5
MTIRPPEREAKKVKVLVDRNPVQTSFEKWAKPGHFSRSLAKGPTSTTWIWDLHADAHDFDSHTSDLEDISRKVFSAHFGQLAWLTDPVHIKPSAQVVWPIVGQEILNGDVGGGFQGIQITSGWFHYHKAAPKLEWFQNVESMLNHHLADSGVDPKEIPLPHEFILNRELMAQLYPSFAKGLAPFFTMHWADYTDFLTFRGGLNPTTGSLWLTDQAHHHLAIAVLFIIAGHMYRTNWGIGHSMKEILEAHRGPLTGEGHQVAHHMYAMPPYPYIAIDYGTSVSLFTHHMWIGGFMVTGAAAHAAIFMVRDYDPTNNYNNVLDRMIRHRDAIISHLNWVCIFLGFHSFGLYIHNDTMSALGRPQDMFSDTAIQLQPVFAQWIQNLHNTAPGFTAPNAIASTSPTWGGEVVAVGGKVAMMPIPLGTADFLVHHIHAFTIHVTVLILLKGVLFARSSRLIPDKANLGFRFPCDGPGRGGTCQVSAWDHLENAIRCLGKCQCSRRFTYYWSGRGYWQELIESIVWAHNKLKVAPAIQPRALSITQGRAVGVAHYLLGGIATTWSFFLARLIAVG